MERSARFVAGNRINQLQINYFQVKELAEKHGLKVHLDGARVFNAAIVLGVPVAQITQHVDSVTICLSKVLTRLWERECHLSRRH